MDSILLHSSTDVAVRQFLERPAHALVITGPAGSGKLTVAEHIGARLLNIERASLAQYPHVYRITPETGKAISIDDIRAAQQRLTLKVPGALGIARILIIENGHAMTTEAQNALLKTLEEPPLDTTIIMTATSKDALLPTIGSRIRLLEITAPVAADVRTLLLKRFSDEKEIDSALMLSGNLPGLAIALMDSDHTHPLYEATVQARSLLQQKAYERLVLVDQLSKQKQLCIDMMYILGQMARTALMRAAGSPAAAARWQKILTASYEAERQLRSNTQTKLVLTNLMLDL